MLSRSLRPLRSLPAHTGPSQDLPPEVAVHEKSNIAVNPLHGAVQATTINLSNPFLGIDLIHLGGSNFEVALLSSLPQLGTTLTNLLGARWLARRANPKRAGALMFLLARLGIVGFALVNLGIGNKVGHIRSIILILLIGLVNIPAAVGNLCWQSLISGLIGGARRARALARRSTFASLSGVLVASSAGIWLGTHPHLRGYVWVFLLASLVGLVEVSIFLRFRGSPTIQVLPVELGPAVRRLWKNRAFRAYTLACLPFYLGWLMAWPLFLRYQVSIAHATNLWIGIFSAVNGLCVAVGNPFWARIGERVGARWTLPAATMLLAGVPATYTLSPGFYGIVLANALGGFAGAGVTLFLLVRLMEVSPMEERVMAIGTANTLTGLVGVIAPICGVGLLTLLPLWKVLWISAALRFSGGGALLGAAAMVTPSRKQAAITG